jgi:hypothetical protein
MYLIILYKGKVSKKIIVAEVLASPRSLRSSQTAELPFTNRLWTTDVFIMDLIKEDRALKSSIEVS